MPLAINTRAAMNKVIGFWVPLKVKSFLVAELLIAPQEGFCSIELICKFQHVDCVRLFCLNLVLSVLAFGYLRKLITELLSSLTFSCAMLQRSTFVSL